MLHIDVSAVNIPYDLLSKEEIEEINRQVILLMNKFGFEVMDKGLPEIGKNFLINTPAAYYADSHCICVNPKLATPFKWMNKMILAHELCHSFQMFGSEVFKDHYADRRIEHEAYTVQYAWLIAYLFKSTTIEKWFMGLSEKKIGNFKKYIVKDCKRRLKDHVDEGYKLHKTLEESVNKSLNLPF